LSKRGLAVFLLTRSTCYNVGKACATKPAENSVENNGLMIAGVL